MGALDQNSDRHVEDYELEPLKVAPEDEPREGIVRRIGKRMLLDGQETPS